MENIMKCTNNKYTKWYYSIVNNAKSKTLSDNTENCRKINSICHIGLKYGPMSNEHKANVAASKKGKIHVDPITGRRYMAYPHQLLE